MTCQNKKQTILLIFSIICGNLTNYCYGESIQITDNNGNIISINADKAAGGAVIVLASENSNLSQNTILVNPAISETQVEPLTNAYYSYNRYSNALKIKPAISVKTNATDAVFPVNSFFEVL